HVRRVAAREGRDVLAAHHTRDLPHPALSVELVDERDRAALLDLLPDNEVAIREGGDLRKMCDDDDLVRPRARPELLAPDGGGAPADPRVHLVEDEGPPAAVASERGI